MNAMPNTTGTAAEVAGASAGHGDTQGMRHGPFVAGVATPSESDGEGTFSGPGFGRFVAVAQGRCSKPHIILNCYDRYMCVTARSKEPWIDGYRIGYGKDVTEAYAAWERQV